MLEPLKCCTVSHVLVTRGWLKMTGGAGVWQRVGKWISVQLSLRSSLGCHCHFPLQSHRQGWRGDHEQGGLAPGDQEGLVGEPRACSLSGHDLVLAL